jgi:hypothetical protein
MKLKPVNVDLDIEGNTVVSDVPQNEPIKEEGNEPQPTDDPVEPIPNQDGTDDGEPTGDGQGDEPTPNQGEPEPQPDVEPEPDVESEPQPEPDDNDVVDYDELPEAVQRYLDFHEETGRSLEDFIKAQTKWDDKPQEQVIREYYQRINPNLDAEDINFDLEDSFGFDEYIDDERTIQRKKIAKKKFYSEALKELNAENAKYGTVLESSASIPQSAKEAIAFKEQFEAQQAASSKELDAKRDYFVKETDKVLSKDFKGFEIDLGEGVKATYKPENIQKTKEQNLNVNNLLSKFTDKDGNITDVQGYHMALTFASDPAAVAKHFYEMGQADNADKDARKAKNIDMGTRQVNQPRSTGGFKVRAVDVGEQKQRATSKPIIKLRNY